MANSLFDLTLHLKLEHLCCFASNKFRKIPRVLPAGERCDWRAGRAEVLSEGMKTGVAQGRAMSSPPWHRKNRKPVQHQQQFARSFENLSRRKWRCGLESNGELQQRFGRANQFCEATKPSCRNGAASRAEWSGVSFGRVGCLGASQSFGLRRQASCLRTAISDKRAAIACRPSQVECRHLTIEGKHFPADCKPMPVAGQQTWLVRKQTAAAGKK